MMFRVSALVLVVGCTAGSEPTNVPDPLTQPTTSAARRFAESDLVADRDGAAQRTDPDLVNAWGIAVDDEGLFWVADNGTGKLSIYDAQGNPSIGEYRTSQFDLGEGITGIVMNSTTAFQVHAGGECAPADFIVASEDGKLRGVNGDVDPHRGLVLADRSAQGAIYKGVAIVDCSGGPHLLAADFHNGRIDAFDGKMHALPQAFEDPALPAHFAPFDVAVLGGHVYVAYAMQDDQAEDEVAGDGLGAIDEFDASGTLVRRLTTGGALNAPWGLALAPTSFGPLAGTLLVGNFGDGRITAYDVASGQMIAQLANEHGKPLSIDGLWGLASDATRMLHFAAGPDDEQHGLFGELH